MNFPRTSWQFVRLSLFILSIVWAGDALLAGASAPGSTMGSLIVPVLALLGFASLSLHELQAISRSRRGPGTPGAAPAARPPR